MTKRPIDYRPADLVLAIVGYAIDDEDPMAAIPEAHLLELLAAGDWKPDTVRRTLGELYVFGAVQRFTPFKGNQRGTPMVRVTALGRAWVDRRVEPYVRNVDTDDDQAADDDPGTLDLD